MNKDIFELHININNDITAIAALEDYCSQNKIQLSKGQLKQAITKGALWLTQGQHTQRLRRIKRSLKKGNELHFYYNQAILSVKVDNATLISDENHYSVWYKPYGMLSQGSKWSDHCTIARFAQQYLIPERPVFIVHRLDRAATGLILIAHSKKAARALSSMFENRTADDNDLEKYYQIIVHGNHSIRPQPEIITADVDGKSAQSTFNCLTYDVKQEQSLLKVKIDSGRKHQIRIHAAGIGLPILGDRLHGKADENCVKNLQLCAVSLSFTCPLSGEKKHFELPSELKVKF